MTKKLTFFPITRHHLLTPLSLAQGSGFMEPATRESCSSAPLSNRLASASEVEDFESNPSSSLGRNVPISPTSETSNCGHCIDMDTAVDPHKLPVLSDARKIAADEFEEDADLYLESRFGNISSHNAECDVSRIVTVELRCPDNYEIQDGSSYSDLSCPNVLNLPLRASSSFHNDPVGVRPTQSTVNESSSSPIIVPVIKNLTLHAFKVSEIDSHHINPLSSILPSPSIESFNGNDNLDVTTTLGVREPPATPPDDSQIFLGALEEGRVGFYFEDRSSDFLWSHDIERDSCEFPALDPRHWKEFMTPDVPSNHALLSLDAHLADKPLTLPLDESSPPCVLLVLDESLLCHGGELIVMEPLPRELDEYPLSHALAKPTLQCELEVSDRPLSHSRESSNLDRDLDGMIVFNTRDPLDMLPDAVKPSASTIEEDRAIHRLKDCFIVVPSSNGIKHDSYESPATEPCYSDQSVIPEASFDHCTPLLPCHAHVVNEPLILPSDKSPIPQVLGILNEMQLSLDKALQPCEESVLDECSRS